MIVYLKLSITLWQKLKCVFFYFQVWGSWWCYSWIRCPCWAMSCCFASSYFLFSVSWGCSCGRGCWDNGACLTRNFTQMWNYPRKYSILLDYFFYWCLLSWMWFGYEKVNSWFHVMLPCITNLWLITVETNYDAKRNVALDYPFWFNI